MWDEVWDVRRHLKDESRSVDDKDDTDQDNSEGNDLDVMGLVIWSEKCCKLMQ